MSEYTCRHVSRIAWGNDMLHLLCEKLLEEVKPSRRLPLRLLSGCV